MVRGGEKEMVKVEMEVEEEARQCVLKCWTRQAQRDVGMWRARRGGREWSLRGGWRRCTMGMMRGMAC
jgi:hypothetical protein